MRLLTKDEYNEVRENYWRSQGFLQASFSVKLNVLPNINQVSPAVLVALISPMSQAEIDDFIRNRVVTDNDVDDNLLMYGEGTAVVGTGDFGGPIFMNYERRDVLVGVLTGAI